MDKVSTVFKIVTFILIVVVFLFSIVVSVITISSEQSINLTASNSEITDFSSGWKKEGGVALYANVQINATGSDFTSTEPLIIRKTIDDKVRGKMLYIHSRDLVINIYANDKPIHITAENGILDGIDGFDNYILATVPIDSAYDSIELRMFRTRYSDQAYFESMVVGPEYAVIRKIIWENVFPTISSTVFIVLGIFLIVFGVSTRKKVDSYLSTVYYGSFLVLIALGMVFESSFVHILFENVLFIEMSHRIFIAACIPPLLAFFDLFFVPEHYYPIKILTIISSVSLPVIIILDFSRIVSLISVWKYFLIFFILCAFIVFEELVVFMLKSRGSKDIRKRKDYVSVFIFLACLVLDIFSYLNFTASGSSTFFTRLGLICMTTFMVLAWFGDILNMIKLGVQAGKIGKIAFTDANTGIGNVAAFKSEFDELESKKFNYKYIGIVQFDVNNLKLINDSKGHEAGDLLIKNAADIINKSFGAVGNCYRTGGDEFVAIITDEHAPIVIEEAIYNFDKLIRKFNENPEKPFNLRIAYGIAYYQNDKTTNKTLKEIHKLADERMYDNKKMLKARYARSPEEAVVR